MLDFLAGIAAGILAAFFVFASSIKIFGWQKGIFETQLAFFRKYGLNRLLMACVGIVELVGALLLWVPREARPVGAVLILLTSLGAIYFHLRFDTWKDGIPAMATAVLATLVLASTPTWPDF